MGKKEKVLARPSTPRTERGKAPGTRRDGRACTGEAARTKQERERARKGLGWWHSCRKYLRQNANGHDRDADDGGDDDDDDAYEAIMPTSSVPNKTLND